MRGTIIYYSLEGNTRQVVQAIARELSLDIVELTPKKQYPDSGFRKYFWGGKSAVFKDLPELEPYTFTESDYDLLILATPIWAGTFTPPLRTFLSEHPISGKSVALLACSGGGPTDKAFQQLKELLPHNEIIASVSLVDPKTKPDAGNETKIEQFCQDIRNKLS